MFFYPKLTTQKGSLIIMGAGIFLDLSPLRVEVDPQAKTVRIFNPAEEAPGVKLNLDDVYPLYKALEKIFQDDCVEIPPSTKF